MVKPSLAGAVFQGFGRRGWRALGLCCVAMPKVHVLEMTIVATVPDGLTEEVPKEVGGGHGATRWGREWIG